MLKHVVTTALGIQQRQLVWLGGMRLYCLCTFTLLFLQHLLLNVTTSLAALFMSLP